MFAPTGISEKTDFAGCRECAITYWRKKSARCIEKPIRASPTIEIGVWNAPCKTWGLLTCAISTQKKRQKNIAKTGSQLDQMIYSKVLCPGQHRLELGTLRIPFNRPGSSFRQIGGPGTLPTEN